MLAGCDKTKPEPAPGVPLTDLSGSPTVLLQVFGARTEPRAVPIAILAGGNLRPITLDAAGWRALDAMVFTPGSRLTIYHRGMDVGTAIVQRGMWSEDEGPLYTLPGCRMVVPQALLRLEATQPLEESIELLASSVPLTQLDPGRPLPRDAAAQGRTIAGTIASAAQIAVEELEPLDFTARWLHTGAGANGRTLLASYIDPEGGDAGPGMGHTSTVFALAEDSAGTLHTSFQHVASGDARTVEFMRLVNHADLDGNGVAEMLIESWRFAAIPDLALLKYRAGRWRETFRVSMNWCVESRQ